MWSSTFKWAQLLRNGGTRLMEPVMRVEVSIEDKYLHAVLGDLAQHRSEIIDVTQRNDLKVTGLLFYQSWYYIHYAFTYLDTFTPFLNKCCNATCFIIYWLHYILYLYVFWYFYYFRCLIIYWLSNS